MITTQVYHYRITSLSDIATLSLPNAFRVYIQCRTPVDPSNTDITCFESTASKIYVANKTILQLSVYDYATLLETTTLEQEINTMLQEHNTQMKISFIQRL